MRLSKHFPDALYERTGMTFEQLLNKHPEPIIVKPNATTEHKIVRKKQEKYPHQWFFIFEEENLFLGYDPNTELMCTAMYLDGRWGYPNKEYDKSEHFNFKHADTRD